MSQEKSEIMSQEKMYRSSYFNPGDKDHLQAYYHLRTTSVWPEDFWPSYVVCEEYWEDMIKSKIVAFYLKENGLDLRWKDLPYGTFSRDL